MEVAVDLGKLGHMFRRQIRNEIETIIPGDALEKIDQADALAWVDSGADLVRLFKPATPPKHLVSYFAVANHSSILLVDHKNAQLWLPPGGHVEPNEHPRDTVLREIVEELGFLPAHPIGPPLMVTCTETVGQTAGHTDVSLWYLVHAEESQILNFDQNEFNAVRWFTFSDVPFERSDPQMRRFIEKLRLRLL